MSRFTGPLRVEFYDAVADNMPIETGHAAALIDPLTWECDFENSMRVMTVPAGFISDGATVPRYLWWFLPPWGDRATRAAILHDYLRSMIDAVTPVPWCKTWAECDHQFHLALLALGVDPVRAWLAWLGVRSYSISYARSHPGLGD